MKTSRLSIAFLLLLLATSARAGVAATPVRVGAAGTVSVKLPAGTRAIDVTDDSNLVVSLSSTGESKEGETEFVVTYVPTRPGTYDLRDFLLAADGKPAALATPLPVTAFTALDPKADLEPAEVPLTPLPRVGGYKLLAALVAVFWTALLVPLIFWKRKPRIRTAEAVEPVPPTPDEQLVALMREFRSGQPTLANKVRLEALLQDAWRRRFGWGGLTMSASLQELRRSPASAELLDELDCSFHAPTTDEAAAAGLARKPDRIWVPCGIATAPSYHFLR
ncbi:MAG: hypothetical protein QM754_00035 [Tepidisphaeraceae bacterium]